MRPGSALARILEMLETRKDLSIKEASEALGVSGNAINTAMRDLTRTGQVERSGRPHFFRYAKRKAIEATESDQSNIAPIEAQPAFVPIADLPSVSVLLGTIVRRRIPDAEAA